MYYTRYQSSIAPIILAGDEDGLSRVYFDVPEAKEKLKIPPEWTENESFFADIIKQLDEYFAGKRKKFDVKLNLKGTEYQKKIWALLAEIPYGQTMTYSEVAQKSGNAKAARAVGGANGKNPVPVIIPCHRVVGAKNNLTGFAFGVDIKEKLIKLETVNK